ncbi:5-(carboxyamino)imidazole ribonucleotide synthase [soil metagenome]
MKPILPGATIGILGGGQLGRMMAMAARTLGYHVQALDPDASCAARFVVDRCITAPFDDAAAAVELARACDVVTLEIEKVATTSLDAAAKYCPVRPSSKVLAIIQDRVKQKKWLARHGFPVGPFAVATTAKQLTTAIRDLRTTCFVKASHGGYDGRGQVVVKRPEDAAAAFSELGNLPVVCEAGLRIRGELSILVARRPSGETAVYAPSLNHHEDRILAYSVMPAPIPPKIAAEISEIAREAAKKLALVGLLVVEFFWLENGTVLVNELAPRPHNTFHGTEVGCLTSQFEQAVRAVCDLPLGSTEITRPVAIYHLLGDAWLGGPQKGPFFDRALALPGVRLHLYGKREARPGRKMGHLSAVGKTPAEAVARVNAAADALRGISSPKRR